MADQGEEDFSRLPVADRLASKNWKARVSAYHELTHAFKTSVSEDGPEFSPYLRDPFLLAGAVKDANAVAQEAGILCACAFVEYGGKTAASASKDALTSAIVEKNIFGSGRAGTKKAAIELSLLLVECDNDSDTVFEACIEGLKSRQPKAVAGAVTALKETIRQFGTKSINVKPVLKVIPSIFGHADKGVRAEGTQLVQELHRWLGSAMDPCLVDLKPVQQKELAELFVGEEPPTQTRFTRAQQRERALKEAEDSLTANDNVKADNHEAPVVGQRESATMDAYDLSEPQQILDALPPNFYENLASAKWKDRKELALDPLSDILKKTPRLQDGSYDDLVRALAGRMTDANIACVISAAGCIEAIAQGLRQDFGRYKPVTVPPILERCKEKKTSVTDALGTALDAIFKTVTISDLTEDVVNFSKHKNPQVREQTFRFLVRSLRFTRTPPGLKTDLKPLSEALLLGMEDGFGPVRDAAAEGLGTLHKIVGDRPMASILDALDDIKKKKVLDFAEKAQVQCKQTGGAAVGSAPTSAASRKPAQSSSAKSNVNVPQSGVPQSGSYDNKENSHPTALSVRAPIADSVSVSSMNPKKTSALAPMRKTPNVSSIKKPVTAGNDSGTSAIAKNRPKATTIVPDPSVLDPIKYRFTPEDAEAQAATVLPETILTDLKDSAWKTRLAAVDALQAWLETSGQTTEAELIVRILAKSPGWKESNFQIYSKMAVLFGIMAQTSSTWTRACSALTIGPLTEKLGDIKLKKPTSDALIAYAERFSLQFVLSQAFDSMKKQKAPKTQSEAMIWIEQALRDFGMTGLAVRELVEFLKTGLKSSNATVRTSAMKALVTLRIFVGPDIKTFVQELNTTLLNTIDSEFDKVNGELPPSPTRTSADHVQTSASCQGEGSKTHKDPLEELFPRLDISKLVNSSLIKMMNDANWKQRKEALESVQSILEANPRLKPTLGELGNALKQRLPDSNKVVQGLALDVIARLANGIGKPFDRPARAFLGPICGILADAKATVRSPAIAALDAVYEQCGLDCMVPHIAAGLEPANPLQRNELASWLSSKLSNFEGDCDLSPLIGPVIACLEDKSADVRKAAQSLLPSIIASTGISQLLDRAGGLKPASRSVVIPILESAKKAVTHTAAPVVTEMASSGQASATASSVNRNGIVSNPSSAVDKGNPAVSRRLKVSVPSRPVSSIGRAQKALSRPTSSLGDSDNMTPSKNRLLHNANGISSSQKATGSGKPPSSPDTAAAPSPFRTVDPTGKQTRAAREIGPLSWRIEGSSRPDQVEYLQQQMVPHTSPDLLALMFSRDHHSDRDHAEALNLLTTAARGAGRDASEAYMGPQQEIRAQLLANSDLLMKYMTIRLCDHSLSIVLSCLDLIEALFQVMLSASYHLTDYEAGCILPSIIVKLGDPRVPIKARVKAIIRSFGTIYPSSKVFAHLLEYGARSQIARIRSESIEELGFLMQRQGLAVCQPRKALQEIALLLSHQDASTQSAALGALTEAYKQVGDELFQYVQGLPSREQAMLDDRLGRTDPKRRPSTVESYAGGTPKHSSRQQSSSTSESRSGYTKIGTGLSRLPALSSTKRPMSAIATPSDPMNKATIRASPVVAEQDPPESMEKPARLGNGTSLIAHEAVSRENKADGSVPGPRVLFALITSANIAESVEALKQVQKIIAENPNSLLVQAAVLIGAISEQMAFAFKDLEHDTPQPVLRLCKHLMQTLSGFFDHRDLSLAVPKATLADLLGELTKRLLETADRGSSDAIVSLSKVLNMVLIRIFHNSDNSACFGSLFLILERATINLRALRGEELAYRAKYAELVMKCLWKISKSVKENLEDGALDPKKLLFDIDGFLQAIPPAEWRRRASDGVPLGDMPLRTVKTILQQVVTSYGESVYQQLTLLDKPENSFVYQYLFRLLNNSRNVPLSTSGPAVEAKVVPAYQGPLPDSLRSRKDNPASDVHQRRDVHAAYGAPLSSNSAAMSPSGSNDIQMNLALKDIFDKIGNAQDSKKGIVELHNFKLQHPEAEARINTWIAATGSFFQSYLRRALSNLAAEEAERAGTQTSPLSPGSSRQTPSIPNASSSPRLSEDLTEGQKHSRASPGRVQREAGRATSGSVIANDEKLDSLKQMFGVSKVSSAS